MRLEALRVEDYPPIKKVDVEGLSGIIVVAGPNGVGKTRLIQAILEGLTNPGSQHRRLVARATSDAEREAWGQDRLDTSVAAEADTLRRHLQQNRRRGKWQSSAFHIDSQRQVTQVQPWQWTWASADPSEEQIGWNYLWQPLGSRYQETIHSIYRMLAFHRKSIATKALELQRAGQTTMTLDFADPLEKFKKAFALLLAPKQLTEISLENPQLRYAIGGDVGHQRTQFG